MDKLEYVFDDVDVIVDLLDVKSIETVFDLDGNLQDIAAPEKAHKSFMLIHMKDGSVLKVRKSRFAKSMLVLETEEA